jgi:hypothetical protein
MNGSKSRFVKLRLSHMQVEPARSSGSFASSLVHGQKDATGRSLKGALANGSCASTSMQSWPL